MSDNDQRCSSRKEDWLRFWRALKSFDWRGILHTGKNILVEEWRRIRGKCPQGDEHAREN